MRLNLKEKLAKSNDFILSTFAIIASFSTYSCMYALRKPIAVATFEGISYWGIDYKILLLTAQVIGYTLSKFAGIKIISEMKVQTRALTIFLLIVVALLALFLFAICPPPYNLFFLLLNGFPLGMIWGLVFSYLEGRRYTEVLGAGLSISFIFSSGFVKTIGKFVMDSWGTTQFWMPFITGALFILPAAFFIWMLDQLPPPTKQDEIERTKRHPMNKEERWRFALHFAPGLFFLIVVYVGLTAFRDFRDNFSAEIWKELGYGDNQMIFTLSEIPVSLGVLIILCLVIFIKRNIHAFQILQLIILIGIVLVGTSTYAFENGYISPPLWMMLIGFGLYLGYVPFNSVLFDRLIATFKYVSNAGFVIYLADAFGYFGSTAILFYKNFGRSTESFLSFFISSSYIMAIVCGLFILFSIVYFRWKYNRPAPIILENIQTAI